MENKEPKSKNKKQNPSQPTPDKLKPEAIKWKKKAPNQKTKKKTSRA